MAAMFHSSVSTIEIAASVRRSMDRHFQTALTNLGQLLSLQSLRQESADWIFQDRIVDLGVVHLSGSGLTGYIALCSDPKFLTSTLPIKVDGPYGKQQRDWLTELTNRLGGAFKSEAALGGFRFENRVARLADAKQTWVCQTKSSAVLTHGLSCSFGHIAAFLCIHEQGDQPTEASSGPIEIVGQPATLTLF